MSGAGLQGYIACGYGEETMRCYGTGLQGVAIRSNTRGLIKHELPGNFKTFCEESAKLAE